VVGSEVRIFGSSASCATILATSTWSRTPCNTSTIRAGQGSLAGQIVPCRTGCPHGHQPVNDRPTGERPDAAEHQNARALRHGDRQQVPRAVVGGLMPHSPTEGNDIVQNRTVAPLLRFAISQNRCASDCAAVLRAIPSIMASISEITSSGAPFCTMWPTSGNGICFALAEHLPCHLTVTDIFTDGCMLHRTL
jgi:hypothetical protein